MKKCLINFIAVSKGIVKESTKKIVNQNKRSLILCSDLRRLLRVVLLHLVLEHAPSNLNTPPTFSCPSPASKKPFTAIARNSAKPNGHSPRQSNLAH